MSTDFNPAALDATAFDTAAFDASAYAAEAEERWGGTDAWRESQERSRSCTKQDWQRSAAEAAELSARMSAAMREGAPAGGARAMDLAEEHRAHVSRWFYTCTYEIHRGLGDMYVSDGRFTASIEREQAGLAAYYRDAIHANATRNGV
ncbi:TipAS antibiotic-recognition domain-containing protein [Nonomuraea rhizosphaerae]|uniref:TipAS antibiotic-recognition domain-containing protein n=1 Tax=Nonomuraea rhizosphaerae TaxID=2665663 RepID=UPI001C5E30C0|nr:TipAS antibiotic-recognition domain-containing protein [Nonomuraea rhizosphaerae]